MSRHELALIAIWLASHSVTLCPTHCAYGARVEPVCWMGRR